MRVSISRRESPGCELARLVHFWWRTRRLSGREVCEELRKKCRGCTSLGVRSRAEAPGRKESETAYSGRFGESHHHLARTGRLNDRARYRDARQQEPASGGCEDSRVAGALQEDQFERPHKVVEPDAELRAGTGEHADPGPRDYAGGAGAQRIARRSLQAGVSGPRRCQLA